MRWKGPALAITACVALQVAAQEPTVWTEAGRMGFHGPIHSQKTTVKKLAPDPRTESKLHFHRFPESTVFDTAGRVLEEAQGQRRDGTFYMKVRNSYDAEDNVTRTENGQVFHEETAQRPDGTVETNRLQDGVLVSRTVDISDKEGNTLESTSYDVASAISSRSVYHYRNGKMTEMQEWGPNNEFIQHRASEFNSEGDLILETFYNKEGKPVTTFSFNGKRLSSYWQDPTCGCSNNLRLRTKDISYSYATQPDGSLETTIQKHPGTESKIEPTEMERYTGDHVLVEKLAFTYERDSHGNWTKRIVSAWDRKTGEMVPIEEDLRTLTYY